MSEWVSPTRQSTLPQNSKHTTQLTQRTNLLQVQNTELVGLHDLRVLVGEQRLLERLKVSVRGIKSETQRESREKGG